jgi:hypothetical protein
MKRKFNRWSDSLTPAEIRTRCLALVKELETWDIRPYRRDRIKLEKTIRFTYNMKRLTHIHEMLESRLETAIMDKIAQGL